jgi:hypothetical protein
MPSQLKSEAARANGAKSKGPATPEGRARSSQNALSHGLAAATIVLGGENEAEFEDLRASYIRRYQPSDRPELELVETMAAARWRLRRLYKIETQLLDNELYDQQKEIQQEFGNIDLQFSLAWVFKGMANTQKAPGLLIRYEGQLTRSFECARKELEIIQKNRPPESSAELPKEPNPVPEEMEAPQQNEPSNSGLSLCEPPESAPAIPEPPSTTPTPIDIDGEPQPYANSEP